MEKKHIIILSFLLLITIAVASIAVVSISVMSSTETNPRLDLSRLELNQNDAYIAISSNDPSGSNRWLPFYFTIESEENANFKNTLAGLMETEREKAERESIVQDILYENITRVTLYSEANESLISTDKVIWTATEYRGNSYQLFLAIQLDLDELKLDKATNIQKITFDMSNGEKIEHILNYTVEARETISEKEIYVSSIPVYVPIREDVTARPDYGFMGNQKITDLELDYPANFANITKHEIGDPTINMKADMEGQIDYPVIIYFSEFGPDQRTVFRPFLRVYSENDSGWLIPGYPAYIWNPESVD